MSHLCRLPGRRRQLKVCTQPAGQRHGLSSDLGSGLAGRGAHCRVVLDQPALQRTARCCRSALERRHRRVTHVNRCPGCGRPALYSYRFESRLLAGTHVSSQSLGLCCQPHALFFASERYAVTNIIRIHQRIIDTESKLRALCLRFKFRQTSMSKPANNGPKQRSFLVLVTMPQTNG